MKHGKKDIKSMTLEELKEEMTALGEKPFRAKQIYEWMHVKLAESFEQMTNIPKILQEKCRESRCVYRSRRLTAQRNFYLNCRTGRRWRVCG